MKEIDLIVCVILLIFIMFANYAGVFNSGIIGQ